MASTYATSILIGAEFARDLREVSIRRYRDLFRTYGRRSFLYAEMMFGNAFNAERLTAGSPQTPIFAMRAPRDIPLFEVTRQTGLSTSEVKRFNPALVKRVPARANLYLPVYVEEFGADVTFWHRPASSAFASVLDEFVRLDVGVQRWHEASFEPMLRRFQQRFRGHRHRRRRDDGDHTRLCRREPAHGAAAPPSWTSSARADAFCSCSSVAFRNS